MCCQPAPICVTLTKTWKRGVLGSSCVSTRSGQGIAQTGQEYPDKTVLELHHSLCPNMFKINLNNLLHTLENIGEYNVITVPEDIKADAGLALDRMLTLAP